MAEPTTPITADPGRLNIDPTTAHSARVYDYLLDGKDNFPADREAAHQLGEALGGFEKVRSHAHANRSFLVRAVHYLVGECGIRQFLDIGTGIPNADNVRAVAQNLAPQTRVMHVDNDPIVLAHAHTLTRSTAEGATTYLHGDLCEPESILKQASDFFDLSAPIAVMLVAVVHLIGDEQRPQTHIREIIEALPAGSHLALTHLTSEIRQEESQAGAEVMSRTTRDQFSTRDYETIKGFFTGMTLVEPGLVPVEDWRPRTNEPGQTSRIDTAPFYGGIARKP